MYQRVEGAIGGISQSYQVAASPDARTPEKYGNVPGVAN